MKKHSNKNIRNKIIGLGEKSIQKSYFPELKKQLSILEEQKKEIEQKNSELEALMDEINQAKEEISEREEKYRLLFEFSPLASVVVSKSGLMRGFNQAFLNMTGLTSEMVSNKHFTDLNLFNRKHLPAYIKAFTSLFLTKKGSVIDFRWEHEKDGTHYSAAYISPIIKNGKIDSIQAIIRDYTQEKLSEEKLTTSENKFRTLFNSIADPIFFIDFENAKIILANDTASKVYGYAQTVIEGLTVIDIDSGDDLKKVKERFNYLKEIRNLTFETKHKKSNGTTFPVEVNANLFDYNGRKVILSICRDITERKNIERELRETNSKLLQTLSFNQSLLNAIPTPVFFKDKYGKYIGCNRAFTETMGVSEEHIKGKTVFELWESDLSQKYHEMDLDIMKKGGDIQVYDSQITDKNKERREVRFAKSVFSDSEGNVAGMVGAFIDITEQIRIRELLEQKTEELGKQNEKYVKLNQELKDYNNKILDLNENLELAKSLAEENIVKMKGLLNAIPDMMFMFDSKGVIIDYHSQKGQELYVDPNHFLGQKIENILPIEIADLTKTKIKTVLDNKKTEIYNYSLKMPNGERVYEARMVYVDDNTVMAISRDVTERVKMIEDLKEAKNRAEESDKLKSSFLQNMSHEVRTPMNGIIGFSQLLINESNDVKKRESYASLVLNSSKQLLSIVDDIIDISRIESGDVKLYCKPLNISELILEIDEFHRANIEDKGLEFIVENKLGEESFIINSDRYKIKQIVDNLINNAIKFTDKGKVLLEFSIKDKFLYIKTVDTGIGIAKDKHDVIFERFRQVELEISRTYGGNGLGLAIVKKLIDLMGGEISLESDLGKGATFIVKLPYEEVKNPNKVAEEKENHIKELKMKDKKTILLVEDEEVNFMLFEEILSNMGIRVLKASDGQKAVDTYNLKKDEIDLILMDIKLPVLNGFEATKIIKGINPNVPIIAQTAYAMASDKEAALEAGCDDYISKPVKREVLLEKINKFLGE